MYLKLMSSENASDSDSRKQHRILSNIDLIDFNREPDGKAFATVKFTDSDEMERFNLDGNAYVMNDDGETISSFGPHPIPKKSGAQTRGL